MRYLAPLVWLGMLAQLPAAEIVDLTAIDRSIAQEPTYTGDEPLYGLAVFGPQAKTRVWMVLDKSDADADVYDVLYADLNANGDLTETTERFTADEATAGTSRFNLPDITDPHSGATHTDVKFRATRGSEPIFMLSVMWRGELKFGGGYAVVPDNGYMRFAESSDEAPIVWMNGDGPFRFQRWYSGELRIGKEDDFKVFLGQEGVGPNSFASFQCHALPREEAVLATLIYTDANGQMIDQQYKLKERC